MLSSKIAVVTGAAKGMGREVAKVLAARGATVIACSRSLTTVQGALTEIGPSAVAEELDVESEKSVDDFVKKMTIEHSRIDILVNAAGYPFDAALWHKKFDQVTNEEFQRVLSVDLLGNFRLMRKVIPVMIKGGGGVIVNFASTPALSGHVEGAPYSAAKAGLIALTKHIALEYGLNNIRAYALALGNIATDATFNSMTKEQRASAAEENAMRRWGRPVEVANAIASLVGNDFSFSTGSTIVLDGGTVLL